MFEGDWEKRKEKGEKKLADKERGSEKERETNQTRYVTQQEFCNG